MGDLAIVGRTLDGGPRRQDWVAIGRALGSVTANDINELKRLHSPPQGLKTAMAACLVALGFWADSKLPTWADAMKLLRSAPASQIAAALRRFNPKVITPAMLHKLKPLVEGCNLEKVSSCSKAASSIAMWVQAVYAYGAHQQQLLSNYAVHSPGLASVPYSKCAPSTGLQPTRHRAHPPSKSIHTSNRVRALSNRAS